MIQRRAHDHQFARTPEGARATPHDWSQASYVCDHCGEEIVVPLDPTQGQSQVYGEDCPVCCHPNVIHVEYRERGMADVWSHAEQDRF